GQTEVLVGAQPGGVGGGELVFLDTTGDGVYTVAGNASCGLFALVCPGDRMVVGGSIATLFFQIPNSASSAQQFQYELSDSLGWIVGHSAPLSGQTPAIAAGGVFTLQVDAQVPPDCVHGRNTLRWSAAPLGNAAVAETCLTHLDCGEPETPCKPPGLTVATDA